MRKTAWLPSLILVIASTTLASLHAEEQGIAPIPARVKKAEDFAAKSWHIDSSSSGDLNKDGRPDAALIISADGEGPSATRRKLIIAFRRKDGSLEKVVENENATTLSCGPSGGVPQVSIKRGLVCVDIYCGSRERTQSTHKYQFRDGHWMLIGYTVTAYDSLDPEKSEQKLDLNLLTGDVATSNGSGKGAKKERFHEIWASRIETDEPSPSDWCPHTVQLASTNGIKPYKVTLQAVHSADRLFIRAQPESGKPLSSGDLILSDIKGNKISPDSSRATIYGYLVNEYDLRKGSLKELLDKSSANDTGEKILRLNVTVKPHAEMQGLSLSTGGKVPGAIFLSEKKGAVELNDVDVRDGEPVHPLLYPM